MRVRMIFLQKPEHVHAKKNVDEQQTVSVSMELEVAGGGQDNSSDD